VNKRQAESKRGLEDTDEQLVLKAVQGNAQAFEELVRRYEIRLRQFLEFRGGDRQLAEDCLQETLWEAHRNLSKFDPTWRFSTWLFTIARRVVFRVMKDEVAKRPRKDHPLKSDSPYAVSQVSVDREKRRRFGGIPLSSYELPEDEVSMAEGRMDLWGWVRSNVNDEEFRVLWLSYVEDLSLSDMAVVLNRSYGGAKSLLFRARRKLRQRIKKSRATMNEPISLPSFLNRLR